jgi:hypothetical protein
MTKTYTIKIDESNWILAENGINTKSGEPTEKNIGYYGSLEALVKAAHNKMILVHGLEAFEHAMESAKSIVEHAVRIITDEKERALATVKRNKSVVKA